MLGVTLETLLQLCDDASIAAWLSAQGRMGELPALCDLAAGKVPALRDTEGQEASEGNWERCHFLARRLLDRLSLS